MDSPERFRDVSKRFVVVYEARRDYEHATELADRVMVESVDWLEESWLDSNRQWIGDDIGGGYLAWKSIPNKARELGIFVHGHFEGVPGQPDALAARRAIAYVLARFEPVDAVLLIRDQDDQPERQQGLQQGVDHHVGRALVVIGLAIPERECWVISGFDAEDDDEQQRLDSVTKALGADPRVTSHELTACKNDQALRSPKRVLTALTGENRERQRKCWLEASLDVLEARGHRNGLKDYLNEIRADLVPLITGRQPNADQP
jgi:hypothetical protein